jgi:hypothetical protein
MAYDREYQLRQIPDVYKTPSERREAVEKLGSKLTEDGEILAAMVAA